jgi:hypothetical protein
MPIPVQIKRRRITLLVNINIYPSLFLSHCIISAALREAYEVGEKLDKLHMAMAKGLFKSKWLPCSNKLTTDTGSLFDVVQFQVNIKRHITSQQNLTHWQSGKVQDYCLGDAQF